MENITEINDMEDCITPGNFLALRFNPILSIDVEIDYVDKNDKNELITKTKENITQIDDFVKCTFITNNQIKYVTGKVINILLNNDKSEFVMIIDSSERNKSMLTTITMHDIRDLTKISVKE